jgi:hypothetical protein
MFPFYALSVVRKVAVPPMIIYIDIGGGCSVAFAFAPLAKRLGLIN